MILIKNTKDSIIKSDIIFICVGTPTKKNDNSADLSQVYAVGNEISKSINKFKIIINLVYLSQNKKVDRKFSD